MYTRVHILLHTGFGFQFQYSYSYSYPYPLHDVYVAVWHVPC